MELLSTILTIFEKGIFDPLKDTFLDLFALKNRQSIFYIAIAYIAAFVIYRDKYVAREANLPNSYWKFIGGKDVFLHPSAIMDYKYFFLSSILRVIIVLPILKVVLFTDLTNGKALSRMLADLFGSVSNPIDPNNFTFFVYGTIVFLVSDFCHYWAHRFFHANKWLWEFHKIHHVAEVLVPPTANRVHFVETIAESILGFILVGHIAGVFYYLCGQEVTILKVAGVGYLAFFFNCLASNLRHTHIWLSFGPKVERFINSPAQHQIHHSTLQKHYNKNFGTNFSIWDWMFGTLYVTTSKQEEIKFGLGAVESRRFNSVASLIFDPFLVCFKRAVRRVKKIKKKGAKNAV